MKIKINTEIIKALKPCEDRLDNYLSHYEDFKGDIQDFLLLDKISHSDKLWVTLRLVPRIILETFAVDCAYTAAANAAAAYAANAANAAAYAAYAANAAAYAANAANAANAAAAAAEAASAAAAAHAGARAANYASVAAAESASAASDAVYAAGAAEKERQLCALEYLIINHEEGEV